MSDGILQAIRHSPTGFGYGGDECNGQCTSLERWRFTFEMSVLSETARKLDARKLSKQNVADMAICSAFIAGFNFGKVTANLMNDTIGPYCLPTGFERQDRLIRTFVRWAARNKRHKKRAAGFGLLKSLQEHYGCDERDRKN